MKRSCWVLFVLLVATLFGGCFFSKQYPTEWPPISSNTGAGCANISGAFKNIDVDNAVSLSDVLLRLSYGKTYLGGATRVDISQADASINIVSYFGEWLLESKTLLFKKDYRCQEGRIILETSGSGGGGGVAGYTWEAFAFQKAEDGSLILHMDSSGIATVVMIIPIAGSQSKYHRFEMYAP